MPNKTYIYIGDGEGLPGLPHEVSEAEAAERGLSDLLKAAIENGNYRVQKASAVATGDSKSRVPAILPQAEKKE